MDGDAQPRACRRRDAPDVRRRERAADHAFCSSTRFHTYGGTFTAPRVALLLRRWRHALGRDTPLHIVGLSATLENPKRVHVQDHRALRIVHEISPRDDDLEPRQRRIRTRSPRGNPVSGTALLSTTIQATFLMAQPPRSHGFTQGSGAARAEARCSRSPTTSTSPTVSTGTSVVPKARYDGRPGSATLQRSGTERRSKA